MSSHTERENLPILKPTWTTYAYLGLAIVVAVLSVWGLIIAATP